MSYIGQGLPADVFAGFTIDKFTGTGVASQTLTLSKAPLGETALLVTIDGVVQEPTDDFTVSGTTVTIVGTAPLNSEINVTHLSGTVPNTLASAVDVNGLSDGIILDADADTTISADTDDQIDFKTGGSDRVSILNTAGANVQVADGIDLLDGNLKVASGHGIDFSATSDATGQTSELLDDYEEGTWTAAFTDGSTNYTMNNSAKVGRYVKIGDNVWIWGYFAVSDVDGGGANENTSTKISGLPFTMENNSENYASVHIGYVNSFALPNALSVVMGYIEISNTYIYLVRNGSTDGTESVTGVHVSDGGTVMLAGMYKAS
jgi:hypothetical protein